MRVARAELDGAIEIREGLTCAPADDEGEAKGEIGLCKAGIDPDGVLQIGGGLVILVLEAQDPADHAKVHAVLVVERHCRSAMPQCFLQQAWSLAWIALHQTLQHHISQGTVRSREARIEFDRATEHRRALGQAGFGEPPQVIQPPLVAVPGAEVHRRATDSGLAFQASQFRLYDRSDLLRHGLLHVQDVRKRKVVGLPPQMMTGFGRNEIHRDTHALTTFRHGPLHQVADPQLGSDRTRIGLAALEGDGGMAAQHVEPSIAGQQANHVFGQAIAEIVGIRLLAQVHERQYRDGRLARRDRRQRPLFDLPIRCLLRFIGRRSCRFLDLADEAEPAPMDRLDQRLPVPVIADRFPRRVDPAAQRGVRHDPSIPDRVEQFVFAHYAIAVSHEMYQQVVNLRFHMNDLDRHGAAPDDAGRCRARRRHSPSCQKRVTVERGQRAPVQMSRSAGQCSSD